MKLLNKLLGVEPRADPVETQEESAVGADLLRALLGNGTISKQQAVNIPAFAACVNLIANTISMIPFRLYRRGTGEVEEVDDERVFLLNDDTGDTLSGVQFKKAMVTDYLTGKGGYAYIGHESTKPEKLYYVPEEKISFVYNTDPIVKNYRIVVNGRDYTMTDFIRILRNTRNGWSGRSMVEEVSELLLAAYHTQQLQRTVAQTGGNKRGFIRSQRHLTEAAIDALKKAWQNLYQKNSENVVVLNDGLEFQESSSTSAELQLNESIETMAGSICQLFGVPEGMLSEHPTEADQTRYIQYCVVPILTEIECSLNRDLLQDNEKRTLFFAADISELTKGNIKDRYTAYSIGIKAGFLQIDEVRFMEHRKPLGLDYVKLGLQDVWYDPESKMFYNPNMNQSGSFDTSVTANQPNQAAGEPKPTEETTEGGESQNGNRNQERPGDD